MSSIANVPERRELKLNISRVAPQIVLALMIAIMSLLNKEFLTIESFRNLMQQVSGVGIVAIGAMFVIISGGIDFTSGYGLAMIGMASATIYTMPMFHENWLVSIIVGLSMGALLGITNGILIGKLNILPFICTLAVMSIAQGLSLLIGGGAMVMFTKPDVLWMGQGELFGFLPVPFLIFLGVCLISYLILNKTKLGIYTFALGGNEEAARYVGINVLFYKVMVYVFAGLCTGLAALLTISRIAMATPSIYGSTLLDAIAATVIGGTSMSGGKGNISGTVTGVFIIVLISTALTYLEIQPEMQNVFKGAIILIASGFDAYLSRYSRSR